MSQVSGSSWTPKTASDQVKQQSKSVQKLSQGDQLCVENKFVEAVQEYVIILNRKSNRNLNRKLLIYISVSNSMQRSWLELKSSSLQSNLKLIVSARTLQKLLKYKPM